MPLPAARTIPGALALLLLGGALGSASAQTADEVATLPAGPKALLAEIATDTAAVDEIADAERSADEWTAHLAGMNTALTEAQLGMLASYLALNTPAEVASGDAATLIGSMPKDGRELFAETCFSCHGVVDYYLLQDRDEAGWMDIFAAPYHRRLLTGDNERETFASYAASAMPIAAEQVPPAWQR